MKTIMHIITRMDRGGSAQNTLLTCLGLRDKYRIVLINGPSLESKMGPDEQAIVNSKLNEFKKRNGIHIINPYLLREISPIHDLIAFLLLIKAIKLYRPDIVHTHTSKAGVLGRISAYICNVKRIVHTPHGHVFYGHFSPLKSRCFMFLEKILGFITSKIIALTKGEKDDYLKYRIYPKSKIEVIHSGVNVEEFRRPATMVEFKKKALGIGSHESIIGTAGWISQQKGSMDLLFAMEDVWEKYPDCRLLFAGRGPLEPLLKEMAIKMKRADKVLFLGWRNDMPDIMHLIDIFVLPSLNEGMGRVIVEAMCSGKPVIASRTGGIPDLVKDGINGYLITPGNREEISSAIIKLLTNPHISKQMGEKGRELSLRFDVHYMIEKTDSLYQKLLKDTV